MKRLLFFAFLMPVVFGLYAQPTVHVNDRDTVRYGDPWYTFNPMPTLVTRYTQNGPNPQDSVFTIPFNRRMHLQAYPSQDSLLYGIAVTTQHIPTDATSNAYLTCWRGAHVRCLTCGNMNPQKVVVFDSVEHKDSIAAWNPPLLKQCLFEYQFGEPSDGVYPETRTRKCFEFYFDTPLDLTRQDTIFIGGFGSQNMMSPPYSYYGIDTSGNQKWAVFEYDTMALYSAYYNFDTNEVYPSGIEDVKATFQCRAWGMIFPITELRCTRPRGLAVDPISQTVRWEQDADAELFQLSICSDSVMPDNGVILTSTDLTLPFSALPSLSADTVYRLYLRKQCDFSTSHTTTVWSDWSDPVTLNEQAGAGETDHIGKVAEGMKVRLQPNPTTGRVTVEADETVERVEVYNVHGARVQVTGGNSVDLGDRAAGVYMLRVTTRHGTVTRKLLLR